MASVQQNQGNPWLQEKQKGKEDIPTGNLTYGNNLSCKQGFVPFSWVKVANDILVMVQFG